MMSDIERVHGNNFIFQFGKYIVVTGKMLYVFNTLGTLIFRRKDLVHCLKVMYVPDDKLLVDVCGEKYYLISLLDGKDIWSIPQTKRDTSVIRFALTPSSDVAFDVYHKYNACYLVRIDIKSATVTESRINQLLRTTKDIMCDHNGILCLLQTHYSETAHGRVSENAIVQANFAPAEATYAYNLCKTWKHDGSRIAHFFFENTDQILTSDLHVYCPSTGVTTNLLENETIWHPQVFRPITYHLDANKRYAIFKYQSANVIVGLEERKVVAKYATPFTDGCIVENEFWVSREKRIQRIPFPVIEDVPHFKYSIGF